MFVADDYFAIDLELACLLHHLTLTSALPCPALPCYAPLILPIAPPDICPALPCLACHTLLNLPAL